MRKTILVYLGLFAFLSYFLIQKITDVNRTDVVEYEKLIQSSHGKGVSFSLSHLYRTNVVKEIWWKSIQRPLYAKIECRHSELVAAPGKGQFGTLEKMQDVKSFYQEKLFYQLPDGKLGFFNDEGQIVVKDGDSKTILQADKHFLPMQEVRYFEAVTGVCSYKNFDFVGEDVRMKKYHLKGHLPPSFISVSEKPISQAEGKKLHCQLKEKGIDLRLDGLKTTFNPKGGL